MRAAVTLLPDARLQYSPALPSSLKSKEKPELCGKVGQYIEVENTKVPQGMVHVRFDDGRVVPLHLSDLIALGSLGTRLEHQV
jgi:hypothetical protein